MSEGNSELLQTKLYFLLEQLQEMSRELPSKYQMRLPYEMLSSLAQVLLDDTVSEIVKGLMDIQNVTEQHLYQTRLEIIKRQKEDEEKFLLEMELSGGDKVEGLKQLIETQKAELKQFDKSVALQLDEKVADQQATLEQAGVPGFYLTKNTLEIRLQMYLLDFILRLSSMTLPSDLQVSS